METLRYKEFVGTVDFSREDNVFFGKIEGIGNLITNEGETEDELQQAFRESADHHLDFCKRNNKVLHKSYTGTLSLRLTPEMHSQVAAAASRKGVSISSYIRQALTTALAGTTL